MKLQDIVESRETKITLDFLVDLWPHLRAYIGNTHWEKEGVAGKRVLEQLFNSPRGQLLLYHGKMERIFFSYEGENVKDIDIKAVVSGPKAKGIHSFFKHGIEWDPMASFAEEMYSGAEDEPDHPQNFTVIEQVGNALDMNKLYTYYKKIKPHHLEVFNIPSFDINFYLERAARHGEVLAPYYPNAKEGRLPQW